MEGIDLGRCPGLELSAFSEHATPGNVGGKVIVLSPRRTTLFDKQFEPESAGLGQGIQRGSPGFGL